MKKYETPELYVDEFAPDTMIASSTSGPAPYKNGNAGNNQNCWDCNTVAGGAGSGNNACIYTPGDGAYESWCK